MTSAECLVIYGITGSRVTGSARNFHFGVCSPGVVE